MVFFFHNYTRFPSFVPGHVTAITRSVQKGDFARRCGADTVLLSTSPADMAAATSARSFQLVINTIPGEHDFNVYSNLLAPGGKHVILGLNSGIAVGMALEALCCGNSRVKVCNYFWMFSGCCLYVVVVVVVFDLGDLIPFWILETGQYYRWNEKYSSSHGFVCKAQYLPGDQSYSCLGDQQCV